MTRVRTALPDALAALALAALVWALFGGHVFLNYDTFYALVWGDDVVSGRLPQFQAPVAPTPHPLAIAAGALASPLGDRAEDALLWMGLIAIGALCVGVFRLGQELFATSVGVLAAVIVATRVPLLNFGVRGYVDLAAVALVVWAAVLEARRPRGGTIVLVLLALAGLLRPEAWLFSVAYWLWLVPAHRLPELARLAALAALAPILWLLLDGLVTGDPLWSFRGTRELGAELERPTGLASLPGVLPFRLGEILRLPELIAALFGFCASLLWLRRRILLPASLAALNGVAYVAFALAGLPLLGRYLFLAASMLALFAALAALGWRALAAGHPARRGWRAGGVVALIAFVVFAPTQLERLNALRLDIAARDRVQADLLGLVRSPAAGPALAACRPLFVPNHRPVPALAYWTSRRPREVISAELRAPTADGLYLAPANARVAELSILDPRDPRRLVARVPEGYRPVARNRSWVLHAGCRAA